VSRSACSDRKDCSFAHADCKQLRGCKWLRGTKGCLVREIFAHGDMRLGRPPVGVRGGVARQGAAVIVTARGAGGLPVPPAGVGAVAAAQLQPKGAALAVRVRRRVQIRRRRECRLPADRQPAAFSEVLEENQSDHVARVHQHRDPASNPMMREEGDNGYAPPANSCQQVPGRARFAVGTLPVRSRCRDARALA
jgi:hypothetical protein